MPRPVSKILTIGYEMVSLEDFVMTLEANNVRTLMDIRAVAVSRRYGFSKHALSEAVENAGIEYVHFRALGNPKPGREAARNGDVHLFREIFRAHLRSEESQKALKDVAKIARSNLTCLLCFERDHSVCHRTIVADRISRRKNKMKVRHLKVPLGFTTQLPHSKNNHEYRCVPG